MARKDIIRMSGKELNRIKTIHSVLEKEITQKKAADILDLSDRQIRRIVKRVGEEGNKGFIHKSRGRRGHRAIPEDVKAKVLELYQERYKGFGPTFATEKLSETDRLSLSRETLRKWLIKGGISYKRRRNRPHKQWRERKQYYGEMVQIDGSEHDWLEGRGPELVLMGYIDDATGKVFAMFYTYEGTIPAMDSFKRYIKAYGIPVSVYLDKHTTYKSNAKPTMEEALCNGKPLSEFERALGELGVRVIHANSPQAKGRIERLFGTLQDRLVKELRLKNVNTIEDANRRLQHYLPIYNKKFSIKAAMTADLHRAVPEDMELDRILCIKAKRVLRNDFTIAYNGKLYQIENNIRARDVIVEERIGDSMLITHKDRILKYKEIKKPRLRFSFSDGEPAKAKEERKPHVLTVRKPYKPSADHPWRRFKPVVSKANLINEDIHNINNYPQKEKGSQKEKRRLLLINNQT